MPTAETAQCSQRGNGWILVAGIFQPLADRFKLCSCQVVIALADTIVAAQITRKMILRGCCERFGKRDARGAWIAQLDFEQAQYVQQAGALDIPAVLVRFAPPATGASHNSFELFVIIESAYDIGPRTTGMLVFPRRIARMKNDPPHGVKMPLAHLPHQDSGQPANSHRQRAAIVILFGDDALRPRRDGSQLDIESRGIYFRQDIERIYGHSPHLILPSGGPPARA